MKLIIVVTFVRLTTPPGCDLAYCAGTAPYCGDDSFWNENTQKCEGILNRVGKFNLAI